VLVLVLVLLVLVLVLVLVLLLKLLLLLLKGVLRQKQFRSELWPTDTLFQRSKPTLLKYSRTSPRSSPPAAEKGQTNTAHAVSSSTPRELTRARTVEAAWDAQRRAHGPPSQQAARVPE